MKCKTLHLYLPSKPNKIDYNMNNKITDSFEYLSDLRIFTVTYETDTNTIVDILLDGYHLDIVKHQKKYPLMFKHMQQGVRDAQRDKEDSSAMEKTRKEKFGRMPTFDEILADIKKKLEPNRPIEDYLNDDIDDLLKSYHE